MRILFSLVLLISATTSLGQAPAAQSACGAGSAHFDVELDKTQHSILPIEPGKARVYFVQDLGTENPFGAGGTFVTRIGIDGRWIGANRNKSWFSISLDPGVHHLCVSAEVRMFSQVIELANLTAEPGQAYYFRIRNFMWQTRRLEFGVVDSDQAIYMIALNPMSVSTPPKQ